MWCSLPHSARTHRCFLCIKMTRCGSIFISIFSLHSLLNDHTWRDINRSLSLSSHTQKSILHNQTAAFHGFQAQHELFSYLVPSKWMMKHNLCKQIAESSAMMCTLYLVNCLFSGSSPYDFEQFVKLPCWTFCTITAQHCGRGNFYDCSCIQMIGDN